MLDLKNISIQFDARLEEIRSYGSDRSELAHDYRNELKKLNIIDPAKNELLPAYSGAKLFETGKLIHSFPYDWKNRHDAMMWVDSVLSGVPVGAVDGSQIYSDKNYEIPVAVLQTSRVFNRHTLESDYKQEIEASIITPDEFEDANVYAFGSEYVDARRFSMECESIMKLMKEHKEIYVFLDGALVLSHINILNRNIREIYIKSIIHLLEMSESTGNPVIGLIDSTSSSDLTLMMHFMFGLKKSKLPDVYLFSDLKWGERTAAFLCDRDDRKGEGTPGVLDSYGRFRDRIAFFYIMTGKNRPARVELPAWVHEKGMIDKIADIIRAESIIRVNYPDILMRAHEAALIRINEHAIFYGMLDNFCKTHGITFAKSAKNFHKIMNR